MSDMSVTVTGIHENLAKPSNFFVDDVFWGYIIRSGRGPSLGVALAQAFCFFFGVCLLTSAIGILTLPTLFFDGDLSSMRLGVAALFGALATYLLWFASRGTRTEVHVDTSVGEIREVICNRAGKPTTVSAYGFDTIGGVYLETAKDAADATLYLRYRNTSQTICVAEGTEAQLLSLRDRLANDLMVITKSTSSPV